MWNIAFNYILDIKYLYKKHFHNEENSILEMCNKLISAHFDNNKCAELENFLKCVDIRVKGPLNLFRYSLIKGGNSDLYSNSDSIYREMRSLVIDIEKEEMVLVPFRKFFNVNEIEETSIDKVIDKIRNAQIFEISNKYDGSMQCARYYNGNIVMVGSKTFVGDDFRITDGYDMIQNADNYKQCIMNYPDYTFIFEFISGKDKHVVSYDTNGMFLIGMRNVNTGELKTYKEIIDIAKQYNLLSTYIEDNSFDELFKIRQELKASDKEGWVIRVDNEMYKLKCEDYLKVHSLYSEVYSYNAIIKAVAENYIDDIIPYLSENQKQFVMNDVNIVKNYVKEINEIIDKYYNLVKNIESQKDFALEVKRIVPKNIHKYMYSIRKGKSFSILKNSYGGYIKADIIFGRQDNKL